MSDPTLGSLPLAAGSFWQTGERILEGSSMIEDAILLLLVLLSVVSWAIVIWKARTISAAWEPGVCRTVRPIAGVDRCYKP